MTWSQFTFFTVALSLSHFEIVTLKNNAPLEPFGGRKGRERGEEIGTIHACLVKQVRFHMVFF